jgi:hypothetical protein
VTAGIWRQRELRDGTYTFADLMDAHEMLDLKYKNDVDFEAWKEESRRKAP